MTIKYFKKIDKDSNDYLNMVINSLKDNNETPNNLYVDKTNGNFNGSDFNSRISYTGSIVNDGIIYLKKKNEASDKSSYRPIEIIGKNIYGCDFNIKNISETLAVELYYLLYSTNNNIELAELLDKLSVNFDVSYKNKKYNDTNSKIVNINVYKRKVV